MVKVCCLWILFNAVINVGWIAPYIFSRIITYTTPPITIGNYWERYFWREYLNVFTPPHSSTYLIILFFLNVSMLLLLRNTYITTQYHYDSTSCISYLYHCNKSSNVNFIKKINKNIFIPRRLIQYIILYFYEIQKQRFYIFITLTQQIL